MAKPFVWSCFCCLQGRGPGEKARPGGLCQTTYCPVQPLPAAAPCQVGQWVSLPRWTVCVLARAPSSAPTQRPISFLLLSCSTFVAASEWLLLNQMINWALGSCQYYLLFFLTNGLFLHSDAKYLEVFGFGFFFWKFYAPKCMVCSGFSCFLGLFLCFFFP